MLKEYKCGHSEIHEKKSQFFVQNGYNWCIKHHRPGNKKF